MSQDNTKTCHCCLIASKYCMTRCTFITLQFATRLLIYGDRFNTTFDGLHLSPFFRHFWDLGQKIQVKNMSFEMKTALKINFKSVLLLMSPRRVSNIFCTNTYLARSIRQSVGMRQKMKIAFQIYWQEASNNCNQKLL